ncbi:MAG: hypothetical protein C4584_01525 [Armatimonadetes bacterium]|nr:MAG: hypothetical protein C4584_01525 [Armatimonadota bacterium]
MYKAEIESGLEVRIHEPIVWNIYSEWKTRGLLDETVSVISNIPEELREPVIYSYITHVHKEKGLFIDLIGEEVGVSLPQRTSIAASADFLWALSLMIDDLEDGDLTRNHQESCWVKYGSERTIEAAKKGLFASVKRLLSVTGNPLIGKLCLAYVNLGMDSLRWHRQMDLRTSQGIIIRNYEQRCDFHGTFPLIALTEVDCVEREHERVNLSMIGLRNLNRAGQLINDLKDIVNGDLYNRSFSDIRNGVVTIPLVELYYLLSKEDAERLQMMFGKRNLSAQHQQELFAMIEESGIKYRVWKRIEDSYASALSHLSSSLSEARLLWFSQWIEYKRQNAMRQLEI